MTYINKNQWGHPRHLWILLGVTAGLNFAFYGFRSFLAPYIAQHFQAQIGATEATRQADLLASDFLALLFTTPIIGGYVADRFLGETRALALALWLGVLSLLLMALPTLFNLELGIALFAIAAGLGTPLTVLIGRNYLADDPRRDGGYTLYYLAIGAGSFISPFICADLIGRRFGYQYGFIAAAVGMALAAGLFQWRKEELDLALVGRTEVSSPVPTSWALVSVAIGIYPLSLLLAYPAALGYMMYVAMGILVLYFAVDCVRKPGRVKAQRYLALLVLFVAQVGFWALSLQGLTSLNFLARDHVNSPFDFSWFQSANPLFIILLGPFLASLWPWLQRHRCDPSTPSKFAIGILCVSLSYGVLVYAMGHLANVDGKIPWWPLLLCYLLQTLGELALSPIGFALVGQLAAAEDASLAMGGWFFGTALAYEVSGRIASLTAGSLIVSRSQGLADYARVYGHLLILGVCIALILLFSAPWIRRLMHGVH